MDRTTAILNRVDTYLSLIRYKYSTEEKLMREKILVDYYTSINNKPTEEKLSSKLESAEELEKGLKLPLKVRGVFLAEGRPKVKYYLAEELEKSADNPINQRFPLMLDHMDNEAGKVIGVVTKIEYDDSIKALRWWGHINDETFARNVIDKAITDVSATIYSTTDMDMRLGVLGRDLVFKELSLVMVGAEDKNSIEPY